MVTEPFERGRRRTARTGAALALASALLGAAPLAVPLATLASPIQPLDSIVAVVNNDVIVQSELDRELSLLLPELRAQGTELPARDVLQRQLLERLILARLQSQRAEQLGIEIDDGTLNQALTSIAERNGLSLEELRQALQQSGIAWHDFRADTRRQLLTTRLQQEEVIRNIRISEQEVDRFLTTDADSLIRRTEVRLQHILIALPDVPGTAEVEQAQRKAQDLVRRLRTGEDFAKLAVAHSDGRRALEGGDLGWFPIAEVPTLAVEPAQTLRRGEFTNPLRSPSGFHIIRIADIKGDSPTGVAQTHARHILIRTSEIVSDEEARRRLLQLRERVAGGDDFATLARAHSDDTGSALKGGDLGWIGPGDTVPEFERVLQGLAPGEISPPFASPFGWHLVQALERREQDSTDAAMRQKASEALRQRKAEEATELWLRQLRAEAYVELRLDQDNF
ncbi:MAG: molecular chaperone SurA [Chromatiaceae bacterium]|nr:MAG: molecular chaperone SurA [Chromatiaceae bacterium]